MKIVGIEPRKYFSKKRNCDVSGFNFYFTDENPNVYGIVTKDEWVSNTVYEDFIADYSGDPNAALGETVVVYYNAFKSVCKIL